MADTASKRNSMGGRAPVPTPRVQQQQGQGQGQSQNSPASMPLDASLNRVLGAKVRVKLSNLEHEVTGYVANTSSTHHSLALSASRLGSQPSGQTTSSAGVTLINVSAIESFQILELAPVGSARSVAGAIPPLTNAEVERNVRDALARAAEEDANQGKGVTAEAQEVFDRLARMFNARWTDGGAFVVNDNVVVQPPYGIEDCKPLPGTQENAVTYVKKILGAERRKMATSKGTKVPPDAEKKGG